MDCIMHNIKPVFQAASSLIKDIKSSGIFAGRRVKPTFSNSNPILARAVNWMADKTLAHRRKRSVKILDQVIRVFFSKNNVEQAYRDNVSQRIQAEKLDKQSNTYLYLKENGNKFIDVDISDDFLASEAEKHLGETENELRSESTARLHTIHNELFRKPGNKEAISPAQKKACELAFKVLCDESYPEADIAQQSWSEKLALQEELNQTIDQVLFEVKDGNYGIFKHDKERYTESVTRLLKSLQRSKLLDIAVRTPASAPAINLRIQTAYPPLHNLLERETNPVYTGALADLRQAVYFLDPGDQEKVYKILVEKLC